jgi:hypothetical protein
MHKNIFITFANKTCMNTDRIVGQAKDFNFFDEIKSKNEDDIPKFIKKHKKFINNNKQGYGFWIWKPKIILDELKKINENDILIYCDAGMYLNINGKKRLLEYLNILKNKNVDILTFSTNDAYKAQYYVKNDAIMNYYPQFNDELNCYCYAGLQIIKKTNKSINLINDWLILCENYHFIDRSPSSQFTDLPHYTGNDCDNGLFNLCLAKYKNINYSIYPDETNIYINNIQAIHVSTNEINWDDDDNLINKPFQCRRMCPRY